MKTWYKFISAGALASVFFITSCEKRTDEVSPSAPVSVQDGKASKMATPTLSAISTIDDAVVSTKITLTAGSTGAPAGFSLQWMTKDAYDANIAAGGSGWLDSSDPALCKASFSGNASGNNYALVPGQSITVTIGDLLQYNGASSNCTDNLNCGTTYVFRAFAHATSSLFRSDFTSNLFVTTPSCVAPTGCAYSQGYWKNHGPIPSGNNQNEWPTSVMTNGLTLGNIQYSANDLLTALNTNPSVSKFYILAHQLIAAKLNVANGATLPSRVSSAISAADLLIGNLTAATFPTTPGSKTVQDAIQLADILNTYNNGGYGVGKCAE